MLLQNDDIHDVALDGNLRIGAPRDQPGGLGGNPRENGNHSLDPSHTTLVIIVSILGAFVAITIAVRFVSSCLLFGVHDNELKMLFMAWQIQLIHLYVPNGEVTNNPTHTTQVIDTMLGAFVAITVAVYFVSLCLIFGSRSSYG